MQLKTNWLLPVACRMRCCTMPSSISRICSRCSGRNVRNTTTLSMRFMNSGENLVVVFRALRPEHPERSEEHTSELQSQSKLVCRLLLEKKKYITSSKSFAAPESIVTMNLFHRSSLLVDIVSVMNCVSVSVFSLHCVGWWYLCHNERQSA